MWDFQLLHRGPLEGHYLPTKCHKNLPIGSKVISGGPTHPHIHTHTHTHTHIYIYIYIYISNAAGTVA
jgi:hypothetical protein